NANHLNIQQLSGTFNDLAVKGSEISGEVKKAMFTETSGFVLEELSAKFKYGETETLLQDLYLKTPNTLLQRNLKLKYTSIDELSANLGNVAVEANLPDTKIGFKDILWLTPDLQNTIPFTNSPNALLCLSANVIANVNDLLVQEFKFSGIGNLKVNAVCASKNALYTYHLWLNSKINDLT